MQIEIVTVVNSEWEVIHRDIPGLPGTWNIASMDELLKILYTEYGGNHSIQLTYKQED